MRKTYMRNSSFYKFYRRDSSIAYLRNGLFSTKSYRHLRTNLKHFPSVPYSMVCSIPNL